MELSDKLFRHVAPIYHDSVSYEEEEQKQFQTQAHDRRRYRGHNKCQECRVDAVVGLSGWHQRFHKKQLQTQTTKAS